MRIRSILLILFLSVLLAACQSGQEPTPTSEPTEEIPDSPPPTLPSLLPAPTRDEAYPAPTIDGAYPGPDQPTPIPSTTLPAGYPEPPTPLPTIDPYPGGVAVIIIPAGIQCEDPTFNSLEEAANALDEGGISVLSAEEEELLVCSGCDCPTSLHYKVTIPPEELPAARALGWQRP
jgi:hypothetical protein